MEEPRIAHSTKISILHQPRIAGTIQKKTLRQWLEEAIAEEIEREAKMEIAICARVSYQRPRKGKKVPIQNANMNS